MDQLRQSIIIMEPDRIAALTMRSQRYDGMDHFGVISGTAELRVHVILGASVLFNTLPVWTKYFRRI